MEQKNLHNYYYQVMHEKFAMYVGKGSITLKGTTCNTKSKAFESFPFFHNFFD